jgi:uncharacterized protein
LKPLCIYHISDLDGKCAAAIVYQHFKGECELYGIDYGWKFPWELVQGRTVIMVDFSLEPFSDMLRLKKEAKWFMWIDHHKTAVNEYEKVREEHGIDRIEGRRVVGEAGCELTWKEFHENEVMPEAVLLLGRYDVWDNKDAREWATRILPFQYGMRALNLAVDDAWWNTLFSPSNPADSSQVHNIITRGRAILDYEKQQNELYAKVCTFETILDGHKVIACNKALANSTLFDSVWDPEKYALMSAFYLRKAGDWKVSLYTTREDVDCSEIAKAHGGGGHRKAAGFISPNCPYVAGELWENDLIQFARLLCEIVANIDGSQTKTLIRDLGTSMDLSPDQVNILFDRADAVWEWSKNTFTKAPRIPQEPSKEVG